MRKKSKSSKAPEARLITNKSNIRYLSNFTGSAGFMLLTKNKSYLFTDFRYLEHAAKTIKKNVTLIDSTKLWKNPKTLKLNWQKILRQHGIKTLGLEESDLTVTRYKKFKSISPKVKFSDISGHIESKRAIKTPAEIKIIQKSQEINEKVFREIRKIIAAFCRQNKAPQLTEIELAFKIKELGHQFGAEDVSFDPIVAFGAHSAMPHAHPDNTKLQKGDIILIDMGMKYQGFCSDMTRMIFTANPTNKEAEIYNLVLAAQKNGIAKIKNGISGKKADALSRDIIVNAGYGEQYGHSGGHGIGLDIHETPSLAESCKDKLKTNMIVTVEPGIYLPGEFGIRIEDMILITKTGNKNLTKIPKEIRDCQI